MTETVPHHYAGFWRRALGWIVDLLILEFATLVVMLGWYAVLMLTRGEARSGDFWHSFALGYFIGQGPDALFFQIVETVVYFLIAAPYTVILTHRYGWTLGKKLVKARVIDFKTGQNLTMARSWGRYFASGLSLAVAGCGYFMAAFHPKKFTLHDLLARTAVIVAPCIALVFLVSAEVRADNSVHWVTDAMFEHASGPGAELGVATWFSPFTQHDFEIGPRLGVAISNRDAPSHMDGIAGVQGSLWFLNAMGVGLEADGVFSQESGARVNPWVLFRIAHLGEEGALGLKAGVFWDTRYGWGYQAGLAMQWNGVQ